MADTGRPPVEIDLEVVEKCAQIDLTTKETIVMLGIGTSTFYRHLENPELKKRYDEAVERGRRRAITVLKKKAFDLAAKGDRTMLIFLLKNHGEVSETGKPYGDRQEVNHTGSVAHEHTLNLRVPADEARRRFAELMQDDEVRQFMLGTGSADAANSERTSDDSGRSGDRGKIIEAGGDAVVSDRSENGQTTEHDRRDGSDRGLVIEAGGDAVVSDTTGEARRDDASSHRRDRGSSERTRTRSKKSARRRNGHRSSTKAAKK